VLLPESLIEVSLGGWDMIGSLSKTVAYRVAG
jgi:hypothetical protein